MMLNDENTGVPNDLGARCRWESRDDLAIRIHQLLEFWTSDDNRELRQAILAASGSSLNALIAGSIAGAIRQDFVIETKRLWVLSGKDRWYRKLGRAIQRAFWALACWNV